MTGAPDDRYSHIQIVPHKPENNAQKEAGAIKEPVFYNPSLMQESDSGPAPLPSQSKATETLANNTQGTTFAAKARAAELRAAIARKELKPGSTPTPSHETMTFKTKGTKGAKGRTWKKLNLEDLPDSDDEDVEQTDLQRRDSDIALSSGQVSNDDLRLAFPESSLWKNTKDSSNTGPSGDKFSANDSPLEPLTPSFNPENPDDFNKTIQASSHATQQDRSQSRSVEQDRIQMPPPPLPAKALQRQIDAITSRQQTPPTYQDPSAKRMAGYTPYAPNRSESYGSSVNQQQYGQRSEYNVGIQRPSSGQQQYGQHSDFSPGDQRPSSQQQYGHGYQFNYGDQGSPNSQHHYGQRSGFNVGNQGPPSFQQQYGQYSGYNFRDQGQQYSQPNEYLQNVVPSTRSSPAPGPVPYGSKNSPSMQAENFSENSFPRNDQQKLSGFPIAFTHPAHIPPLTSKPPHHYPAVKGTQNTRFKNINEPTPAQIADTGGFSAGSTNYSQPFIHPGNSFADVEHDMYRPISTHSAHASNYNPSLQQSPPPESSSDRGSKRELFDSSEPLPWKNRLADIVSPVQAPQFFPEVSGFQLTPDGAYKVGDDTGTSKSRPASTTDSKSQESGPKVDDRFNPELLAWMRQTIQYYRQNKSYIWSSIAGIPDCRLQGDQQAAPDASSSTSDSDGEVSRLTKNMDMFEEDRNKITDLMLPALANLYVNKQHGADYSTKWGRAPDWAIDHGPNGDDSFFGGDWGQPPQRVGRDPRYATMHGHDDHSSGFSRGRTTRNTVDVAGGVRPDSVIRASPANISAPRQYSSRGGSPVYPSVPRQFQGRGGSPGFPQTSRQHSGRGGSSGYGAGSSNYGSTHSGVGPYGVGTGFGERMATIFGPAGGRPVSNQGINSGWSSTTAADNYHGSNQSGMHGNSTRYHQG